MSSVVEDSRRVTPGCLYAALPGTRTHGREFVHEALQCEAAAILSDCSLAGLSVPYCIVPDARRAYGELCHALHFNPSSQLGVVGVTGTNGKSTTTWLVRALLERSARTCGLLGTIDYSDGMIAEPATLTTPDATTLALWLGNMVARGTQYAALELSSHALDQQRTAGLQLDVAIVTNVTQDHFDYHGDFDSYVAAKARIAERLKPGGVLFLNADDQGSMAVLDHLSRHIRVQTFGVDHPADTQATVLEETLTGTHLRVCAGAESVELRTPLFGRHNVENVLAAIATVQQFGLTLAEIAEALPHCFGAPGRLQRIGGPSEPALFVDYAHTPDALQRIIGTLRHLTFGRVIAVFGAGGDRDETKRPLMGRAASEADVCIVTSDNPRTESPEAIAQAIVSGITLDPSHLYVELDRRRAIELALELAESGDAVLVAGKGHEREQIVGRQKLPFDEIRVCGQLLARRNSLVNSMQYEQE